MEVELKTINNLEAEEHPKISEELIQILSKKSSNQMGNPERATIGQKDITSKVKYLTEFCIYIFCRSLQNLFCLWIQYRIDEMYS